MNSRSKIPRRCIFLVCAFFWWVCTGCGPRSETPVSSPPSSQTPPVAPDWFVFRPSFQTDEGEVYAGTAFPIRLPGYDRPVILTAIHLLGPGGGMSRDVPPAEIPKVVKGLRLHDCFDVQRTMTFASEPLVIREAAPLGASGRAGDIVAFWAPKKEELHCVEMSVAASKRGEQVWLVASVVSGAPADQRLHPARVMGMDDGYLLYQYENPKVSKQATSGAPVINQSGRLVAINLGGFESDDQMVGIGNPVGRFRKYLETAAAARR
jgi:hypothetical protein